MKKEKGFTLLELIIALTIIGIVAIIALTIIGIVAAVFVGTKF